MLEPAWTNQLAEARKLPRKDLVRHASVSTDNNHQCVECFACACVVVLAEHDHSDRYRHSTPWVRR